MKTAKIRQRGESAASELATTLAASLELIREQVVDRLEEIDTRAMRKQADRYSGALTNSVIGSLDNVLTKVRPRRRRRVPTRLLMAGGLVAGAGIAAYFLSRRPEVREKAVELTGQVQNRVRSQVGGAADESKLKQAVEQAIFSGGTEPAQLKVEVEGRTVYLRGEMDDRVLVDQAIRKAQSVDGVAAVIDLVSA